MRLTVQSVNDYASNSKLFDEPYAWVRRFHEPSLIQRWKRHTIETKSPRDRSKVNLCSRRLLHKALKIQQHNNEMNTVPASIKAGQWNINAIACKRLVWLVWCDTNETAFIIPSKIKCKMNTMNSVCSARRTFHNWFDYIKRLNTSNQSSSKSVAATQHELSPVLQVKKKLEKKKHNKTNIKNDETTACNCFTHQH
jgi:hypothetical protein